MCFVLVFVVHDVLVSTNTTLPGKGQHDASENPESSRRSAACGQISATGFGRQGPAEARGIVAGAARSGGRGLIRGAPKPNINQIQTEENHTQTRNVAWPCCRFWAEMCARFFAVVIQFLFRRGSSEVAIWFRYVLQSHHNHSRHELFQMVNVLQDQARDSLKSIEANVDKTADLTAKAAHELEAAHAHQGRRFSGSSSCLNRSINSLLVRVCMSGTIPLDKLLV